MIYIRVYEAISTHTAVTVVGFFSFKIVDNELYKVRSDLELRKKTN